MGGHDQLHCLFVGYAPDLHTGLAGCTESEAASADCTGFVDVDGEYHDLRRLVLSRLASLVRMAVLGVHTRVFWVELHSLEGCMMVLEQVGYRKVLEVVDHRKALELEICRIVLEEEVHKRVLELLQVLVAVDHKMVLVSSYKMALVVYMKVLVQVDSEMVGHRMVFEREDCRKASLVALSLMEQHR